MHPSETRPESLEPCEFDGQTGSFSVSRRLSLVLRAAAIVLLTGYFLYFNWGSLRVHFALDDLANMGHYFNIGRWQLVLGNLLVWRGDSRPLGALFYMPIYRVAGLDPEPYQAVLLAILLGCVLLVRRLAVLLGSGEIAAFLAALVACYHSGVANLYYNAAFVFDALCCFFYLAALVYYMRVRRHGRLLSVKEKIIFLALFLCALNSKEMAVTLPILLLVYEWLDHPSPARHIKQLFAWLKGPALPALFAAILDAADVVGKIAGRDAMVQAESYHPVFTLDRLYDYQKNLLQDLSMHWAWFPGWLEMLGIWGAVAVYAWWRRSRPIYRFLFWFLMVVPIPIEFLPGKRQACFALLMMAAAIFASNLLVEIAETVSRGVSRLAQLKPLEVKALTCLLLLSALVPWIRENHRLQESFVRNSMASLGSETWDLIQQFPSFKRPPRGSHVAFIAQPLGGLDMYFLTQLWFKDDTADIHIAGVRGEGALGQTELARMDRIYTFEGRKLVQIR